MVVEDYLTLVVSPVARLERIADQLGRLPHRARLAVHVQVVTGVGESGVVKGRPGLLGVRPALSPLPLQLSLSRRVEHTEWCLLALKALLQQAIQVFEIFFRFCSFLNLEVRILVAVETVLVAVVPTVVLQVASLLVEDADPVIAAARGRV